MWGKFRVVHSSENNIRANLKDDQGSYDELYRKKQTAYTTLGLKTPTNGFGGAGGLKSLLERGSNIS